MSIQSIREIKKEIRVIGITVFKPSDKPYYEIIGVIFRGNIWFDGVLRAQTTDQEMTSLIAEMISSSKHYRQIRVVLVKKDLFLDGAIIDPPRLAHAIKKPIIALCWEKVSDFMEVPGIVEPLGDSSFAVGLKKDKAKKIIKMVSRGKDLPEVLRVASLLREELS